jgi:uncharacterized protein YutE (UPF0331/DUF86 family)
MPASKEIILLKETINQAGEAAAHLSVSVSRCSFLIHTPSVLSEEQLIELDALTSRFARLSDLLIQKIFKTIERLDLETPGTVRDRILQAEKKGLIDNANILFEIREVRNSIAHDYEGDLFKDIVSFAFKNAPVLIDTLEKVKIYSKKFYSP